MNYNIIPKGGRLIFTCLSGSHLYGSNTPDSDVDTRGVFIAPKEYYRGFKNKIEQATDSKSDTVIYELRKFMALAVDCNPNIVELLFVPKCTYTSEKWKRIVDKRHLFLSKKARWTFSGYAVSQLNRIKVHRRWLLDPPSHMPTREEYGLNPTKSLITKEKIGAFNVLLSSYLKEVYNQHPLKEQIDSLLETVDFMAMVQKMSPVDSDIVKNIIPITDDMLEILQREQLYLADKKRWDDYVTWTKTRNEKRAELERKFGFDTKHGSHLFRLIEEGKELLLTGNITFPCPFVEEMIAIRNGAYQYDELMEKIGDVDVIFNDIYSKSILPNKPDVNGVDELCIDLVGLN